MPLEALIVAQSSWALRQWPGHLSRRAPSLDANLICPLSIEIRAEFAAGSGGELGRNGKPGKMSSLRSSSALTYNVFGSWCGQDLQPLSLPLQAKLVGRSIRVEQKYRHGLPSIPPNIDVVIDGEEAQPLAIECKFTEPYGKKREHQPLDSKYFEGGQSRWSQVGLPKCQSIATSIGNTMPFRRLAAGQLLKHLLGLAHSTGEAPRLRYIWYDTGCPEALEHRNELDSFADAIDRGVDFVAITYQIRMASLLASPEPISGYHAYLRERYFVSRD